MSLSGRSTPSNERREHIVVLCARGAKSLTCHGRSKRWLGGKYCIAERTDADEHIASDFNSSHKSLRWTLSVQRVTYGCGRRTVLKASCDPQANYDHDKTNSQPRSHIPARRK